MNKDRIFRWSFKIDTQIELIRLFVYIFFVVVVRFRNLWCKFENPRSKFHVSIWHQLLPTCNKIPILYKNYFLLQPNKNDTYRDHIGNNNFKLLKQKTTHYYCSAMSMPSVSILTSAMCFNAHSLHITNLYISKLIEKWNAQKTSSSP